MIKTKTLYIHINDSNERGLLYYDWITRNKISCYWDYIGYKGGDYMIIRLEEADAIAFKLVFNTAILNC